MPRRTVAALLGLLLSLTLAACGDDSEPSSPSPSGSASVAEAEASGFPVTITTPAGEVTFEEAASSIVSLSSTSTEVLFAIGAGDEVVAVDRYSTHPPEAPEGDLDALEPNVEAIAAKDPDLVVLAHDSKGIVASLQALDIPVLLHDAPTDLETVYEQIGHLGQATGHVEEAEDLAGNMETKIESVFEETQVEGLTYYWELDNLLYTQTSNTFLGTILGRMGLVNIADEVGGGSEYPQLSAEHIIDQDPDLIFLADTQCCQQDAETVAARPGWGELRAVKAGAVVELDDDVASRWGPRLVDLVQQVAEAAEKAAAEQ